MFEKLKNLLKKETKPEQIIIGIHGFGVRRSHEFDDFVEYANSHLPEIKLFDLFDFHDENDDDYHKWVERAKNEVAKAINENKEVYLVGFSMGGVIASHLASMYKVKKLILISPAFHHFSLENYTNIAIQTGKNLFTKEKKPSIPKKFYNSFMSCVKEYKNDITKVTCPVLIIQGDDDEIIPIRSSEWAYEQIPHSNKKCVFLHEGKHRILDDHKVKEIAFDLIDGFIHNRI